MRILTSKCLPTNHSKVIMTWKSWLLVRSATSLHVGSSGHIKILSLYISQGFGYRRQPERGPKTSFWLHLFCENTWAAKSSNHAERLWKASGAGRGQAVRTRTPGICAQHVPSYVTAWQQKSSNLVGLLPVRLHLSGLGFFVYPL